MYAPSTKLSCDQFGLKVSRLLLPIDLAKCPPEIFPLANGFVKPFGGEIVLLHVLDRRTEPTRNLSDVALHRAGQCLEHIGRDYLRHTVDASFRVRMGIPHEEIAAEAEAIKADLLLLPTFHPPFWKKLTGSAHGETARNLTQKASCLVFVISVRARFNCFRSWTYAKS
jgi:nucleotide-binding universal stress UspA family protein